MGTTPPGCAPRADTALLAALGGPPPYSTSPDIERRRSRMRSVLCAALVAAACAPADKSRAPAAGPAQKYAGTWDGRAYHSESDTGTPSRIVSSVAEDGSLRGTLMFPQSPEPPIPVRARQVSDTALVDEIGPYQSPTTHRRVLTTTTGRLHGDSLNGTFEMRPGAGRERSTQGTLRSQRAGPGGRTPPGPASPPSPR